MSIPPNQSSILDQLEKARNTPLFTNGGKPISPNFLPGLSESKLQQIETKLSASLPDDLRELMIHCGGIVGLEYEIDFTGSGGFGMEEIFPRSHTIAADGFGNFWVVDVLSKKEAASTIFFACHDAPVILYQCGSMSNFIAELIRLHTPPFQSLLRDVNEDRLFNVWDTNPCTIDHATALNSSDTVIHSFAAKLDERYHIVDLRSAKPGMGFSWGGYGSGTEEHRCGEERIFAYAPPPPKPPGFFSRLFGKTAPRK